MVPSMLGMIPYDTKHMIFFSKGRIKQNWKMILTMYFRLEIHDFTKITSLLGGDDELSKYMIKWS